MFIRLLFTNETQNKLMLRQRIKLEKKHRKIKQFWVWLQLERFSGKSDHRLWFIKLTYWKCTFLYSRWLFQSKEEMFKNAFIPSTTPGKRSTCTPSVYFRKSIWPVSADQLTCINKHAADCVTKFNVSLYFYFNFGCKSEDVICCGNEYGQYRHWYHMKKGSFVT